MNLNELKDDELIFFIGLNSEEAFNMLANRYKQKALRLSKEFYTAYSNPGVSLDELTNVCLEAVLKAAKGYKTSEFSTFRAYWAKIARNDMIDYVKRNAYSYKRKEMIAFSLDDHPYENEDADMHSMVADSEKIVPNYTLLDDFIEIVKKTDFKMKQEDKKIFIAYLNGFEADEISEAFPEFSKSKIYRIIRIGKTLLAEKIR